LVEITIWSGLVQGSILALIALGFILALLPSGVFNFAQGALVVSATYGTYVWLHDLGVPVIVALLANAVLGAVAGALSEVIAIRPLRWMRVPSNTSAELVTTIGLSTAIVGLLGVIWGYSPLSVPWRGPTRILTIAGVRMLPIEVVLVAGAVGAALLLFGVFRFTLIGQACRAAAEDRETAMLRGVNVSLLSIGGFTAAGVLAGVSAFAIGPETYAVPTLANSLALGGFVALAMGGELSFIGALGGGLVVGLVESFAGRYLGANYVNMSVLAVLLTTLVIRPKGLAGRSGVRVV
jgi:branched-chain amino acid transport system permease protein